MTKQKPLCTKKNHALEITAKKELTSGS